MALFYIMSTACEISALLSTEASDGTMNHMYIDFSGLFHQSSKKILGGGNVHIPKDSAEWPEEWKRVEYKTYPRFPRIPLLKETETADFFQILQKRMSRRDFAIERINLAALSKLLLYSCGITRRTQHGIPHRAHPSGGGVYPIEIYPLLLRACETIQQGVYHYNIKEHALDVLWERQFNREDLGYFFNYEWAKDASVAIVLTAVFGRSQQKYGERGYRYILLEAGHIGQNICLVAEALGINVCPIVGTNDKNIERVLDIDGVTESVVYVLMLGSQVIPSPINLSTPSP